ncbi:MAG: bis(5'-nucleosyl)-tetraphosphatase (symmetrical) YqeK [Candidatus Abyssubacteria bacterium]
MQKEKLTPREYCKIAREHIQKKLSGALLKHVLGSAEMAGALAEKYGVNPDKAATAAYLHDLTKYLSLKEQIALAREMGMSDEEINSYPPAVLHGPLSAMVAMKDLGIDDAEVLQAITAHSSGCAGMGDVAKVVFISDYIEHTREFPGAAELRIRQHKNLDEAVISVLQHKLRHLVAEKRFIDPRALACWNELVGKKW